MSKRVVYEINVMVCFQPDRSTRIFFFRVCLSLSGIIHHSLISHLLENGILGSKMRIWANILCKLVEIR